MSWQTRTVCQFIAATIRTDKGKQNPAMEAAGKIVLDDLEKQELEAMQSRSEPAKPAENAIGSYEKLMAGFTPR